MRIVSTTPLPAASRSKARGSADVSASFNLPATAEKAAAGPTSAPEGLQSLDALLMLQSVEMQETDRERAKNQGNALLDELDRLKVSLLEGRVSSSTLDALAHRLADRQPSGDPELEAVLDAIEVRTRVEMAKLGRFH